MLLKIQDVPKNVQNEKIWNAFILNDKHTGKAWRVKPDVCKIAFLKFSKSILECFEG